MDHPGHDLLVGTANPALQMSESVLFKGSPERPLPGGRCSNGTEDGERGTVGMMARDGGDGPGDALNTLDAESSLRLRKDAQTSLEQRTGEKGCSPENDVPVQGNPPQGKKTLNQVTTSEHRHQPVEREPPKETEEHSNVETGIEGDSVQRVVADTAQSAVNGALGSVAPCVQECDQPGPQASGLRARLGSAEMQAAETGPGEGDAGSGDDARSPAWEEAGGVSLSQSHSGSSCSFSSSLCFSAPSGDEREPAGGAGAGAGTGAGERIVKSQRQINNNHQQQQQHSSATPERSFSPAPPSVPATECNVLSAPPAAAAGEATDPAHPASCCRRRETGAGTIDGNWEVESGQEREEGEEQQEEQGSCCWPARHHINPQQPQPEPQQPGLHRQWPPPSSSSLPPPPELQPDGRQQQQDEPDLVIEVSGGSRIRAHKSVLAAKSDFFRARLSRQFVSVRGGLSHATLRALVDYLYTGTMAVSKDTLLDLVSGARFLQMPCAAALAVETVKAQLEVGNCLELLSLAKRHGLTELRDAAYKYMSDHYLRVLREPGVYGRLTGAERELILRRRWAEGEECLLLAELGDVYERLSSSSSSSSRESSRPQSPAPGGGASSFSAASSPVQILDDAADDGDDHKRRLHRYDPQLDRWRPLCSIPEAAAGTVSGGGGWRGCGLCTLYNYLFVAGGLLPSNEGVGSPPSNESRRSTTPSGAAAGGGEAGGPRASIKSPAGAVGEGGRRSSASSTGGAEAGGPRAGARPSDRVFCYNPLTGSWSQLRSMRQGRSQLKLVALDGFLYAIGGECLFSVERYDPRSDRWSPVAPLPKGAFAVAHEAAACAGELYVSGGSLFYRLLKYDPRRDRWEECPCNSSRRRSAGMVALGSSVYRFDLGREPPGGGIGVGGGGGGMAVFRYNAVAKVWSECASLMVSPTSPPRSLQPFRCAVLGGDIYCVNKVSTMRFSVAKGEGEAHRGQEEKGCPTSSSLLTISSSLLSSSPLTFHSQQLSACTEGKGLLFPFVLTLPAEKNLPSLKSA